MRYISTRGGVPSQSFCDILLGGLAPGGGLYLPETYPQVTDTELNVWRYLPYHELAFRILGKFIYDIPVGHLSALCRDAYQADNFRHCPKGCDPEDITPLAILEPGLYLLGLSNGPTLAFKDVAMKLLGNLFEYVLAMRGETMNILGATSGDTGSSAEYAMLGKKGIRVFMLSPHGKMSPFQSAQMYSLHDPNIFNIEVNGVFDDCQDIVKAISGDAAFKAKYKIGAVNSINWARVAAQIVYYFKGYFAATKNNDQEVSFAVPTGNFGDICAGHIARRMGLPIKKLVLATNENDVLDDFFHSGVYRPRKSAETHQTSSPSMDISKASNFERFIFDVVGRDPWEVRELWARIKARGHFDLDGTAEWRHIDDFGIVSGKSWHADRLATIRHVWKKYGIMVDTHTADGIHVGSQYREPGIPMIALETAQPAKFAETIQEALGRNPTRPAELEGIEDLPQYTTRINPDVEVVKQFIAEHAIS
ncbi:MAG: threonine synthase [Minisyncoccia bacterium]